MDFRYETYDGTEPYIFISYSHQDAEKVIPLIRGLQDRGFRVWYDAGIQVGTEWPEYIAERLSDCTCFLAFISPNAIESPNCRQEINYAIDLKKNTVAIYLEEMALSKGMQMRLGAIQAIYYYRFRNNDQFLGALSTADVLEVCREAPTVGKTQQRSQDAQVVTVTSQQKQKKPLRKDYRKFLIPALAVVLAIVIALFAFGGKQDTPQKPAQDAQQSTPDQAEDTAQQKQPVIASNVLMGNTMDDYDKEAEEPAFNTPVLRKEVGTITFLDTLQDAPADAADASQAQDGGVKAWAVKNGELYDLFIAAQGGVQAPDDAACLFMQMPNLTAIHFADAFHTENTSRMSFLFAGDLKLASVDVSGFQTDNVTAMRCMFQSCKSLEQLDVSGFRTNEVTNMAYLFSECAKLEQLDVSGFNTAHVTDMQYMFSDCASLKSIDLSSFNTAQLTNMTAMFCRCNGLQELDLSSFKTHAVKKMTSLFYDCNSLKKVDLSGFDTKTVTSMYAMFYGCSSLTELDLSHFDTSNVGNMEVMFLLCSSLQKLDISGFNTAKVTSMKSMFSRCSSLAQLDVSNFDTGSVTDMEHMFSYCNALEKLDVSNFNTANVTNMYAMFYNCKCAADVDVAGFNTEKVEKFEHFLPADMQVNGKPWTQMFL